MEDKLNNLEARRLMKNRPDHRSELSKLLRKVLSQHGLTKSVLSNDQLHHVVKHGYRKTFQYLAVSGEMYCSELWEILGGSHGMILPVYNYTVAYVIGERDSRLWLDDALDISAIENHFELMVGSVIAPIVRAVQTPVQAVSYAIDHPVVLSCSESVMNNRLATWAAHYGLEFKPKSH